MKLLKMNWVKTPSFKNGNMGAEAFVAFDLSAEKELVRYSRDKEITGYAKPTFKGYVQKNGKKIAVYDSSIVGILTDIKHLVLIDGVDIKRTGKYLPVDLIVQSEESSNQKIVYLAQLLKKINAQNEEFKQELDTLFNNKKFVPLTTKKVPQDIKWETFTIGNKEYSFDFNYGVEKILEENPISGDNSTPMELFRSISKEKIPELRKILEYNMKLFNLSNLDIEEEWQLGFNQEVVETPKQMGFKY